MLRQGREPRTTELTARKQIGGRRTERDAQRDQQNERGGDEEEANPAPGGEPFDSGLRPGRAGPTPPSFGLVFRGRYWDRALTAERRSTGLGVPFPFRIRLRKLPWM